MKTAIMIGTIWVPKNTQHSIIYDMFPEQEAWEIMRHIEPGEYIVWAIPMNGNYTPEILLSFSRENNYRILGLYGQDLVLHELHEALEDGCSYITATVENTTPYIITKSTGEIIVDNKIPDNTKILLFQLVK